MYYFYETHTGEGIFVSNKKIPTKDLCCDMCGGEDIYLGKASNAIEA